ncbi:hypothetical protein [Luteipulveratus halotolerans]|uniref:TrbL/VirB6 plasmid conjugal transfer protein n=1 Tax=Luteipulveratus halotolerans TaxID=1631356 RepID=A0A0L6CPK7_9MICO|nr:hypothetical protein [Luteipulveratus halotolerans]KNX39699.1 hypothetical protein VV01_00235 [Luteipulveratus halotolerans]
MMQAPPTGWTDWIGCATGNLVGCVGAGGDAKDAIKGAASSAAGSAFEGMVKSFLESTVRVLEVLSTFWMKVPDPKVANQDVNSANVGSTELAGALAHITTSMGPFLALLSVGIIMIQCLMAVFKMSGEPLLSIGRQLLAIVVVQGSLAAVVQLGLQATNDFSAKILNLPGLSDQGLTGLLTVVGAMNSNTPALWLLLAILAILGSLMQLIFMLFRGPLIILLVIACHVAAATAAGKAGQQRLTRAVGLLTSFIIYKAVAAIIYATGFMLIYGVDGDPGQKTSDTMMNTLYGFTIVILAAIALPAVIKFVDPIAGSTGSSLFSGAVAAGAIAGGAVMVATGGASAAGGGAAAAGAGTTGTTAATTAGQSTAGTAATEGGGAAGPGGGPGGGGGDTGGGGSDGAGPSGSGGGSEAGMPSGGGGGESGTADAGGGDGGSGTTTGGEAAAPSGSESGAAGAPDGGTASGKEDSGGSGTGDGARSGGSSRAGAGTQASGGSADAASGGESGSAPTASGAEQASSGSTSSSGGGSRQLPAWAKSAGQAARAGRKTQEVTDEALAAEGANA